VGVWQLGPPIGRRCFAKIAGDLVLLTTDGFLPLSKALISGDFNPSIALSDRIRTALATAIRAYGANFGWQATFYPGAPAMVFNIPLQSGAAVQAQQYVMNTVTGAWCRFSGWNAYCFEVFQDRLYFGGVGVVRQAWTGQGDLGANIVADAKHAFTDYGAPGQQKIFRLARPTIQTDGRPGVLIGMNVDYEDVAPTGILSPGAINISTWGSTTWGGGVWGGGMTTDRDWESLSAIGIVGAFRLKVSSKDARVRWSATDVVFEPGSIL
jgi:hypothetical protein